MQITEVKSNLWSMSLAGPGEIVQGIDYINQNINNVLLTRPGEDLLRPEFGCGLFDFIDKPIALVSSKMKNEVVKAITLWIPQIKVKAVTPVILLGKLTVKVEWSFINTIQTTQTNVNYGIR